jgi:hypothetical protein
MGDADHTNSQFAHHQADSDTEDPGPELGFDNRAGDDWLDMERLLLLMGIADCD